MVSPVLYQEMLLGSRRNRQYLFRWAYAVLLLIELAIFLIGYMIWTAGFPGLRRLPSFTEFANFARTYLELIVAQHFILLVLVTPTVTAGAITDEKQRGTLQYLLTADLRPGEIVLGKLLGRSFQVLLLTLTALPLLGFLGVYAGVDGLKFLALAAATLVMIFALGSVSLLASVLCRHTRDAVLSLYSLGLGLVVLATAVNALLEVLGGVSRDAGPAWLRGVATVLDAFNPLQPLGSDWLSASPTEIGQRLLALLYTWGLLGSVCLTAAVLRLRGAYLSYLQGAERKKPRWWRAGAPAWVTTRSPGRSGTSRASRRWRCCAGCRAGSASSWWRC